MRKKILIVLFSLISFGLLLWGLSSLLSLDIAVLNPKGIIAAKQKGLLAVSTYLMLLVVVPVFVLLFFFAWKYRADRKGENYQPDWAHSYLAESLWWGIPLVLIAFLAVLTWNSSHELDPYKPIVSDKKPLKVQVVSLNWKWLFIYPEQGIATVNYLEIPEKTPIHFEITAEGPMTSFWIPQLGGQIYAMAGMTTQLFLTANEKGTYRGTNSQLSGVGFSGMNFKTVAASQEEFDNWIEQVKQSPLHLNPDSYEKLIQDSINHPVTLYVLDEKALFDKILMKYSEATGKEHVR
jgi:cytochrome o ubiquinol oxidase subunit II